VNPEEDEICIGPGIVEAIIRLGRAQEKLKTILETHLDQTISKHDPQWHSEYERENDQLYEARCKLNCLHDDLWNLMAIIQPGGE
jgi:hypothetical protein